MRSSRRTILAVAITVAAAVIGMTAWALDRVDPGMTFGQGNDAQGRATLTIGSVTPGGLAWYEGVHAGDVVINVGGIAIPPGDQAVSEAYENSREFQWSLLTVPPAQLQEAPDRQRDRATCRIPAMPDGLPVAPFCQSGSFP
jgi:hypothetical protein